MYRAFFKRMLDIILSALCLALLWLPMLIIAAVIKIEDPGPAIFVQKRIGKEKTHFDLYKFRSMKVGAPDIPTHLLSDPDEYITEIGRFIRKTSLDELPQLWNVLKGDMSLVGPRPAIWNYEELIIERDKYGANNIRPGLTGWAQINGRDELSAERKAELDGEYVKKCGFLFDCKCLAGTVLSVLLREGIVEGGSKEKDEKDDTDK